LLCLVSFWKQPKSSRAKDRRIYGDAAPSIGVEKGGNLFSLAPECAINFILPNSSSSFFVQIDEAINIQIPIFVSTFDEVFFPFKIIIAGMFIFIAGIYILLFAKILIITIKNVLVLN
jgi:hypothetical protein